jgi:UDP-N-acetylglucosamine pyrophosphorylase
MMTLVLKLSGQSWTGTGIDVDKANSLFQVKVKDNDTFLDLTAKQVIQMRKDYGMEVKFILMNSFSTSKDTLDFFRKKYPALAPEDGLEMRQNKVPKLDATTFQPATCPSNPDNELCPPAYGDMYAAFVCSGRLEALLAEGFQYVFVSNSDNLGASLDSDILTYFAKKDASFLIECCVRTENHKNGKALIATVLTTTPLSVVLLWF